MPRNATLSNRNELGSGTLATRKPVLKMNMSSIVGEKLARSDANKTSETSFQSPPRQPRADELESFTRSESVSSYSMALPPWPIVP